MSADIIQFVPKPNPNRKDPQPNFDAYDHRTIDYSALTPTPEPDPPKEPA